MLGASAYLLGTAEIAAIAAAAALGGSRLRERLAPGLAGVAAAIATSVLAVALLILVAEALGTFGLFLEAPYVLAVIAAGAGVRLLVARPAGRAHPDASPAAPLSLRLAGIALAALAVAHFTIGVRLRLSTGMTGFDSTWYHGPFAAGFAQSGHTFRLQLIAPQFLAWFYPQNSELLHGVGDLVYGRDILSPLVNLGWFTGCLAAAWAIGRPYGAGPVSGAGTALILATGILADQAGEARNDLAAAFFLLAAVAIAVNAVACQAGDEAAAAGAGHGAEARGQGKLEAGAVALVALAAGLAAGTKVNLLAVAVAMVAGLIWLAGPGTRRPAALAAVPGALIGGGYWYLRNLVHAGNPLPQVRHLGPVNLPAPAQTLGGREGHSVASYLTDGSIWSDWFGPGLHAGLGLLWPALLVLGVGGLALCLGRRAEPVLRLAGLAGLVALGTWILAPTSASGPDGIPRGFESGLRYLAPALLLGAALAPAAPILRSDARRRALMVVIAAAFPFAAASAGDWSAGYLAAAVAVGVLFAVIVFVITMPRRPSLSRGPAIAGGLALALLVVAGGYRVQRTYLENRYSDPSFTVAGLDAAFRWAQPISGKRIATTTTRTYPLLGRDLSNTVRYIGIERPHGGFVATRDCRSWLRRLAAGDYDFVVASRDRLGAGKQFPPQAAWTAADPSAKVVLRRPPTVVFALHGHPDPASCGR